MRTSAVSIVLSLVLTCAMPMSAFAMVAGDASKVAGTPVTFPSVSGLSLADVEVQAPDASRTWGQTAIDTAVEISKTFRQVPTSVVIATSASFPDALAGAPLAHVSGGPLLLTEPNALNPATRQRLAEMASLGSVGTVYLLGGRFALSESVETEVRNLFPSSDVLRVWGETQYDTAAAIALEVGDYSDVSGAVIASGVSYYDALSVAGWAAWSGKVILLTPPESLTQSAVDALELLGVTAPDAQQADWYSNVVVGGNLAVSDAAVSQIPNLTRIGGIDKYETSALIAQYAWESGMPSKVLGLATSAHFADALAAGPWCASEGSGLVLSEPHMLPEVIANQFRAHASSIEGVHAFGGPLALSDRVVDSAVEAASLWVNANAQVVDAYTDGELLAVEPDRLVFSSNTAQIESLQPGHIIQSNPTEVAPLGYMRRVQWIEYQDDGVVVLHTQDAEITDVVVKGTVDVLVTADYAEDDPSTSPNGTTAQSLDTSLKQSSRVRFAVGYTHTIEGSDGQEGQLKVNGSVDESMSFVMSINIDVRWSGIIPTPYVKKYEHYLVTKGTSSLEIAVSGSTQLTNDDVPITPKINLAAAVPVAGFVIQPTVQLNLSVGCELSGEAGVRFIQETPARRQGVLFANGVWSRVNTGGSPKGTTIEPIGSASASFDIGLEAQLEVSVCGIAGLYLDVTFMELEIGAEVDFPARSIEVYAELNSSIEAGLRAELPVFGAGLDSFKLASASFQIAKWTFKIAFGSEFGRLSEYFTIDHPGDVYGLSDDGRYALIHDWTDEQWIVMDSLSETELYLGSTREIELGDYSIYPGAISSDGRYVVVARDTGNFDEFGNGVPEVILHDIATGTERPIDTGRYSREVRVSDDGRFVLFSDWQSVSLYDVLRGTTDTLLVDPESLIPGPASDMSDDGRFIVCTGELNGVEGIILYDRLYGSERVLISGGVYAVISGDGSTVVFTRGGTVYSIDLSSGIQQEIVHSELYEQVRLEDWAYSEMMVARSLFELSISDDGTVVGLVAETWVGEGRLNGAFAFDSLTGELCKASMESETTPRTIFVIGDTRRVAVDTAAIDQYNGDWVFRLRYFSMN